MAERSPEKLLKLFESYEVVEFKDIQSALDNASRATCFRSHRYTQLGPSRGQPDLSIAC